MLVVAALATAALPKTAARVRAEIRRFMFSSFAFVDRERRMTRIERRTSQLGLADDERTTLATLG